MLVHMKSKTATCF